MFVEAENLAPQLDRDHKMPKELVFIHAQKSPRCTPTSRASSGRPTWCRSIHRSSPIESSKPSTTATRMRWAPPIVTTGPHRRSSRTASQCPSSTMPSVNQLGLCIDDRQAWEQVAQEQGVAIR
ncbi:MAG: hypothetical protein ACI9MC_002636 [Kiritimatiellia bacterium]